MPNRTAKSRDGGRASRTRHAGRPRAAHQETAAPSEASARRRGSVRPPSPRAKREQPTSGRPAPAPQPQDGMPTTLPGVLGELSADHARVRNLLSRLEGEQDPDLRARLFHQVDLELWVHARIEEEIVYPAFREAAAARGDRVLYFEHLEEHRMVDRLLEDMRRTDCGTDVFAAQCKVLREQVTHHADEEEAVLWPRCLSLLDSQRLEQLAISCQDRRLELLSGRDLPEEEPPRRWFGLRRRSRGHEGQPWSDEWQPDVLAPRH